MSRIWDYVPIYESELKEAQRELDIDIESLNEAMSTVYAYKSIIESSSNLEVIREAENKAGRTLKDRIKGVLEKARKLIEKFINWIKDKLKIIKKKKSDVDKDKSTSTEKDDDDDVDEYSDLKEIRVDYWYPLLVKSGEDFCIKLTTFGENIGLDSVFIHSDEEYNTGASNFYKKFKVRNSKEFKEKVKREVLNSKKEKISRGHVNRASDFYFEQRTKSLQKVLKQMETVKSEIEDKIKDLENTAPDDFYKKRFKGYDEINTALDELNDLNEEERREARNKRHTDAYNEEMKKFQAELRFLHDSIQLFITTSNMLERLSNEEYNIEKRAGSAIPMTEEEGLAYLEKKLEEMYKYVDSLNFKDE